MALRNLFSKHYISLKISLIYLLIGSLYIIFSDQIITSIFESRLSIDLLTSVQTYKGLVFVMITSVILFVLIQREIKAKRIYIRELEIQKDDLEKLATENEIVKGRIQERNIYIETILKNLPIGLAVNKIDDGNLVFMNKKFTQIYGWPKKDLSSMNSFFERVYPDQDYRNKIKNRVLEDINRGDPEKMHWEGIQITTRSGDEKFVNAQNIPVFKQNLMISIVQDVTSQITAEKKIIENEKKFRAIFENSIAAILIADDDGKYISVNSAAIEMFGYSKEEFSTLDVAQLTSISGDIEKRYKEYLAKGKEKGELDFIKKTGERCTALYHAVRVSKDFNLSIMMDITEKKMFEKEITESNNLLERIVDNLNEVVLLIEPEGRYIKMANAAVEKIFGYTQHEIIGKPTELLHINREKFLAFAQKGNPELEKNGVFQTEYQMKHKNGSIIETENTVNTLKEVDGWKHGVVSVIRDITEQKKSNKKLTEYQESLKQLSTEISLLEESQRKEIAANIHDHLSQLLVISKMKLTDFKKTISNASRQSEIDTIITYISEALENTRRITFDLSPPILYELGLIETLYWYADKTEKEHHIRTQFKTKIEELEVPEPKLILIFRIIQELINNTIKHAQANQLIIELGVTNQVLEILVSDDGKGFNSATIPTTKIGEGGFGLFTIKERVQNLKGRIIIQSEKKKGTKVKIYVPLG